MRCWPHCRQVGCLVAIAKVSDVPGWRLHRLRGDLSGHWSVQVLPGQVRYTTVLMILTSSVFRWLNESLSLKDACSCLFLPVPACSLDSVFDSLVFEGEELTRERGGAVSRLSDLFEVAPQGIFRL